MPEDEKKIRELCKQFPLPYANIKWAYEECGSFDILVLALEYTTTRGIPLEECLNWAISVKV